jgi:hypothetical protein
VHSTYTEKLQINGQIKLVQSVFNDTGLSYVFESQFPICMSSIKSAINQFIQKWFSDLDNSAREFYKVVKKKDFKFEQICFCLN